MLVVHSSGDEDEPAAVSEEHHHHEITLASQAGLPPHERTYGPVLLWEGATGTTPHLLFRPLRFTAHELWDDSPRQVDCSWQLTYAAPRCDCRLIHTLLADHGFTHAPTSPTFNIFWSGNRVKPALLLGLNEYQKVNHFPGTHEITRKDRLARTLSAAREAHGSAAYGFVPVTYVLPADTEALLEHMRELEQSSGERAAWIVKPSASSRGNARLVESDQSTQSGLWVAPLLGTARPPRTDPPGSKSLHALGRSARGAQLATRGWWCRSQRLPTLELLRLSTPRPGHLYKIQHTHTHTRANARTHTHTHTRTHTRTHAHRHHTHHTHHTQRRPRHLHHQPRTPAAA